VNGLTTNPVSKDELTNLAETLRNRMIWYSSANVQNSVNTWRDSVSASNEEVEQLQRLTARAD